ncbi:hypothetical protein EVAR_94170_1 [Eumeta japonica]|uniref:Uncharacterized protein n=1 Tax=Eumeta variegata TaxID=151549 RepID=A0A4C1UMV7_EUMVA|nr:hypothetical protein EVAR_94170_1 [Eumeta japonica]
MRAHNLKYFVLIFFLTHCCSQSEFEDDENDEFKLMRYINVLDEIIQFAYKFRNNIFINLGLGLFLAKVTSLFNETTWLRRIRNYENKVLLKTLGDGPIPDTVSWETYMERINQGSSTPDRYQSIDCMASVGENPLNTGNRMTRCRIREDCYEAISDGTGDGYALTHRLLIILVGHFGRNCYIFSKNRDENLIQDMCAWAFKEAQYIAEEGYLLRDLMMEQISLCTLNGYSEFMQHDWFSKFSELQSAAGCFAEDLDGDCREHPTAVAASSFAAAVRFLCQELY